MANNNLAHLDLKPDNLLVDNDEKIVIADFGKIKELNHKISAGGGGDAAYEIKDDVLAANEKLDIA